MSRYKTQSEHDIVVRESARTYAEQVKQGYKVSTNPGSDKNFYVGTEQEPKYPDVVVWKPRAPQATGGSVMIIEEIETEETVTEDHASQWKEYGGLGVSSFRLIVPKAKAGDAKSIVDAKKIRVSEIWSYSIWNGSVHFEKFHVYTN